MAEEKQNDEGKLDVRETPAFRGVVKQLEELKSQLAQREQLLAEMSNAQAQAKADEERKRLEASGQYEAALKSSEQTWSQKLAEMEAKLAQTQRAHDRAMVESDLAAHGVVGKARTFLAESYLGMTERPELSAWIESAKTDAEFGMFFSKPRQPQPGDGAGRAAANSGSMDWAEVRKNLASADARVRQHMKDHGVLPW